MTSRRVLSEKAAGAGTEERFGFAGVEMPGMPNENAPENGIRCSHGALSFVIGSPPRPLREGWGSGRGRTGDG